ncbi:hypothetical protein [Streptomyces glebosus]|nr:hypothetical protein [Streptomyces glebosus]
MDHWGFTGPALLWAGEARLAWLLMDLGSGATGRCWPGCCDH